MRILITGGFGFVGGRVAQHLQQAGHEVVLGSRNERKSPKWLPRAKVVKTDWKDVVALKNICSDVDLIIQAAGMNVQDCVADPVAALEFNGLATARLVDAASQAGVKRFIYLSTAHVYSNPLTGIINEYSCPSNLHPYATSHLAGENAVLSDSQRGELEGIVLRLSNAYGAPVHKDVNCWMLLANDLCQQAVQTKKMILKSNGLQHRDFVSMAEVCCVIESFSTCDIASSIDRIFNVGSGSSQSVREMGQLIQDRCKVIFGYEPELSYQELRRDESYEELDFSQVRRRNMTAVVDFKNNIEIDNLLVFCSKSFNQDMGERL
jgi:UDP-glucose 4-epimerase